MRVLVILFCLHTFGIASGQTVILPDTNFRNKLIASYPQVMQGDSLNISQAAALTGSLTLSFSNISNAYGVQYFTSITNLDLTNNNIDTLPDISTITGLQRFYASNNKLT